MEDGSNQVCCRYGWAKWPLAVGICLFVGVASAFFSVNPDLDAWYISLNRPSFAPPSSVFGPVWIVLYVMMGLSAAVVWRRGLQTPGVCSALLFFIIQLFLNGIWTPLFFAARAIGWALVDIVLLWMSIGLTIKALPECQARRRWGFCPIGHG